MTPKSIFSSLIRADDGTFTTAYGRFVLKSGLQPIFRQLRDGSMDIAAFEGLVRPFMNGEPVSPGQFFPQVAHDDIESIDSILRTIHILNTGRLGRRHARIFVNFHPGLFRTPSKMTQEVQTMRLAAHEAGMSPDRIVCEISDKAAEDTALVADFTGHMRDIGFRVALDGYGAGDSDIERIKLMKPHYVKFEATWVREFMTNSAGAALLRVIVNQFMDDGIQPVFEALEEMWQVDLCHDLGVPLMQGYVLARPELAPTTFNDRFPELGVADDRIPSWSRNTRFTPEEPERPAQTRAPVSEPRNPLRPARSFGKRGT